MRYTTIEQSLKTCISLSDKLNYKGVLMEIDFFGGIEDKTKATILKAALKEIAEHGYANATTRGIAKTAGVANGLVFYHFKDKKTLYAELINLIQGAGIEKAYLTPADFSNFYAWLRDIMSRKVRFSVEHPEVYKVFIEYIRLFPDAYEHLLQKVNSLPQTHPPQMTLEQEICYAALEGIINRLAEQYRQGKITSEQFLAIAIQKAEEYINYFERGAKS